MKPYYERKGDYYVNPCLSQLKTYLNSKIGNKKGFYYETKASISLIPMRRMCLWFPIMKRKEIIMWIHVYPSWKAYFNSKIGRNRSFSFKTKASMSFIPTRRMCLWCLILKRKEIIVWVHVYCNWKMNLNSKNGRKTSFSHETKASKSFIPTSRMWLWCPIMKRKEIIMWIHVYPNWKTNLNSKNGRKTSFLMKSKHQNHLSQRGEYEYGAQTWKERRLLCESMFIPIERRTWILKMVEKQVFPMKPKHRNHLSQRAECDYGAQSWKERRLLCESMFIPIERRTWILKTVENKFFLWNQSIQIVYHNKENAFMVPNHEKKGYYYMNPCLS